MNRGIKELLKAIFVGIIISTLGACTGTLEKNGAKAESEIKYILGEFGPVSNAAFLQQHQGGANLFLIGGTTLIFPATEILGQKRFHARIRFVPRLR